MWPVREEIIRWIKRNLTQSTECVRFHFSHSCLFANSIGYLNFFHLWFLLLKNPLHAQFNFVLNMSFLEIKLYFWLLPVHYLLVTSANVQGYI